MRNSNLTTKYLEISRKCTIFAKKIGRDTIKSINMKENPDLKLSIIVPVCNVEKYIRACMESIFKQGLDEDIFEVIIVNDGTQDRSMEVIEDIIAQHKNITAINQENQGISMARNNGMAIARGEYLLMPDPDDLLIENSVKPLLEKALETKADMVIADFLGVEDTFIDQRYKTIQQESSLVFKEKKGKELFLDDLVSNECYVWRTIYRRDFLISNNISFYPGITFQDIPFTHKCYLKSIKSFKTHWLLYVYRIRQDSVSSSGTFCLEKAHDFCIAIAQTWDLKNGNNLDSSVIIKLNNDIYHSFQNLLSRTIFGIDAYKDKIQVIKLLRSTIPDLRFNNGIKQKIHTLLFRTSPHLYIIFLMILKKTHWHHQYKRQQSTKRNAK